MFAELECSSIHQMASADIGSFLFEVKFKLPRLTTNQIWWTWTSLDNSLNQISVPKTPPLCKNLNKCGSKIDTIRSQESATAPSRFAKRSRQDRVQRNGKSSRLRLQESLAAQVKSRPLWSAGTPPSWRLHLPSSGALCYRLNQLEFFNDFSRFLISIQLTTLFVFNLINFEN
jgi:hypothetical protein